MSLSPRRQRPSAGAGRLIVSAGVAVQLAGLATPVQADGLREIDQTCATTTGCFSGDAPGFPVTIDGSAGRSYRLTTSLLDPGPIAVSALVQIQADDVTLDLNGFELSGCAAEPCSPSVGSPLAAIDGTGNGITVRNGRIRVVQQFGIRLLGAQHTVSRILIGDVGAAQLVHVGPASRVSEVAGGGAVALPAIAFSAGAGSIVERSFATAIGAATAYRLEAGSLLNESRLVYLSTPPTLSSGIGVSAAGDVRVARCLLEDASSGAGIDAASGASIMQNLVRGNLDAGARSHVQGNLIDTSTAGTSLVLDARSTYRDNVVSGLGVVAPVSGVGFVNMGANACNGAIATCP